MGEKNTVFLAALAGLLHDVGKFAQRAGDQVNSEWQSKKAEFKYQHALHTWHFIDKYVPKDFHVGVLAAYHHRPQNAEQLRIRLADQLSASERDSGQERDDSDRAIHPRQLHPIFWRVTTDDGKTKHPFAGQDKFFFGLNPLKLDEDVVFARPEPLTPDAQVWKRYEDLWMAFCGEAKTLGETSPSLQDYTEAMQALLQRYAWCIPSAYFDAVPDISLYDHSRMTAALAACLVELEDDKIHALNAAWQKGSGAELDDPIALLVGGDISGVQDFIYTITNKGATSALRGRSFYLQLLTEAAARFVLRELGLPVTNLIYGGGGNFYILARAKDKDKLKDVRQKLSRILYKHHQGDLYVAVEGIPLTAKDFMRPSSGKHPLSEKWGELARQVAVVKNQRFAELDEGELAVLFEPQGHGGNLETQCVVCGREYIPKKQDEQDEKDKGKCDACLSYEDLGRRLRDARFISWKLLNHPASIAPVKADMRGGEWRKVLNNFGFDVHPCEKLADIPKDASLVWALSDNAFDEAQKANSFAVLVRRLLVNVTPRLSEPFTADDGQSFDKDDIKPFEKLAKDSQGIKRLGVFRADVDNLGKLFAEGLDNDATLSRIASLSFAVSLFFEGWVGEIAKKRNEERTQKHPESGDALYAIYSGGDDLFFVGAWDELVEFAWQVNEDLKKYTGGHPGIHLSGGMVLVTEKYPLAKAAQDAEEAEKAAKGLAWWDTQGNPHKKNVFAFLGQPLPWSEFKDARDLKARLTAEELDGSKRMAVIRKLLLNYDLYARAEKKRREQGKDKKRDGKPQTLYGPWNWRIVYLLKRNLDKDKPQHKELMENFRVLPGEEKQPDYARLDWVGVAARWVELEDR